VARVDFYLLSDVDEDARHRFVCRLAYKAVTERLRVHVHARDAEHVAMLDSLLWEYPDHQFLPHAVAGDPDAALAPLVIGYREPSAARDSAHGEPSAARDSAHGEPSAARDSAHGGPTTEAALLINLGDDVPTFFGRFERVAEVVIDPQKKAGRDRYRYYRERGHALFHHELDRWEEK
jgi:DNA polymerase-3 subunit chi